MLPRTIHAIICGSSNCSKTNVLISLLESPNGVSRIRLFEIAATAKESISRKFIYVYWWNRLLYVLQQQRYLSAKRRPNFISIFDVAYNKQGTREYFSIDRHANLLILFKQDGINLKHVYNDHVNTDMSYDEFCTLCRDYWWQKYRFLMIDKDSALKDRRYRKEFNKFAIP